MLCMDGQLDIGQTETSQVSFEWLFETYYTPLVRYAFTMLKDEFAAEDITQSVFVSIWESKNRLHIHTSAKALLYKSVYFRCINHINRKKTEKKVMDGIGESEYHHSDDLEYQELDEKIRSAIDLLPKECKKIFLLSRLEDLKYKEIAERLDLSVKTIENQMGKALRILRNELKDYLILILICLKIILS